MSYKIKRGIESLGLKVGGPVSLPRDIKKFTLLRGPTKHKKSQERFIYTRRYRLLIIDNAVPEAIDILNKEADNDFRISIKEIQ